MPILIFVGAFIIGIAIAVFLGSVIAWNVTDIVNVGANFWNVFWLSLVAMAAFGSAGASKK